MKKAALSAKSRVRLDARFKELGPPQRFAQPVRGWVRAIREGLGMTSAQLAKRLGVKQPTVVELEHSEARGSIQLATLRRAAEALNCTLVYALIPNQPLEKSVRDRALLRRTPVEHSMLLEDQAVGREASEAGLEDFIRDMNPRRLWDEP
jgi:predicted DNA-binding mobile mystery protein A